MAAVESSEPLRKVLLAIDSSHWSEVAFDCKFMISLLFREKLQSRAARYCTIHAASEHRI